MKSHLFLHHCDHVERVSHRVEGDYLGQLLETGSLLGPHFCRALGARVHIIALQHVLDTDLFQALVQTSHFGHLAPHWTKNIITQGYYRYVYQTCIKL